MRGTAPRPVSTRAAALLAVVGGAAWGVAHGTTSRPLLAAVALAPLLVALAAARPALWGWLHGVVAWCVAIPWIVPTLATYGLLPGWLAGLSLLLLAGFLGLYDALFAALGARLWRRGDGLSLAALPALWVAVELLRGWVFTGFPWNLAAYAWTELPGALPLAAWIGAWGVSALVVATAVGAARAVATRRWRPAAIALLLPALLLGLAGRFARPAPAGGAPRTVRLVQPNIPNRPLFDPATNAADYRRLLELTRPACRRGDLVLWPESAAWPRLWQEDVRLRLDLQELVREGGCALLLNTAWTEAGRTFNSVVLVESAGAAGGAAEPWSHGPAAGAEGLVLQRADKRHLVPFGEYVPLAELFSWVGKVARMAGEFSPAAEVRLLAWSDERLGPAVCYEVVFPGETAELVRRGATLLVTVTNDAWYGDSSAPRQHLRAARFRAAENRRWLVRAAVTGISAAVRPDGSLAASAEVGETAVLTVPVEGRRDRSPFQRAPWLVPALAVLLASGALAASRRASR